MSDIVDMIKLEIYEDLTNTVLLQSEIITELVEATNSLIHLLKQHEDVDEGLLDPIRNKVEKAAAMRSKLEI